MNDILVKKVFVLTPKGTSVSVAIVLLCVGILVGIIKYRHIHYYQQCYTP